MWLVAVAGTSSDSLALRGDGPPIITTPLVDRSVLVGSTIYFRAAAVGVWPLSYQWQFNNTDISGATNALLIISNAQPADAGFYSLSVTNSLGTSSTQGANLTVLPKQTVILAQTLALTNGQASFLAAGPAGLVWSVQGSTNLFDWFDLATLTNNSGTMSFTEPVSSYAQRYYRLRLVR
jgi:hypothetical protein